MDALPLIALFVGGLIASVVNILAGGGSFLSLAVLMGLGLPAGVANATNRVGILAELVTGSFGFWRLGQLRRSDFVIFGVPALLGGLGGAYLAIILDDRTLRVILALMMLVGAWTVLRKQRSTVVSSGEEPVFSRGLAAVLFLGVGFYSGFIQAGAGFIALAATNLLGYDLKRGNAIKIWTNLIQTVPTLALFAASSMVDWKVGLILAVGMGLGGLVGADLSERSKPEVLRKVIAVAIVGSGLAILYPLLKGY